LCRYLCSEENFEFITARGKHFICALKDNRLVALSEEDKRQKRFTRVDELQIPEHDVVRGWLKGYAKEVLVVRQVFKNKDGSTGTLHLVCSDLTCGFGPVAHANDQDAEQSRVHVNLRRFQARVLESEKQAQPVCHVPKTTHQCITSCLR
jgi:hypothetical protein